MRKLTLLFVICAVLLCGCKPSSSEKNTELNTELYETALEELTYAIDDPFMFSANEAGVLVCADRDSNSVKAYSADGVMTNEFPVPEDISIISLACNESHVFFIGKNSEENLVIGEIGQDGVTELYCEEYETLNSRISIEASDDKIYFSSVGVKPKVFSYPDGAYRYNGLVLYEYDLKSEKCEKICEIVSFTKNRDGGVMLYCCDDEGFYFTVYNGSFGEKYRSKLGDLYAFCLIGENSVAYPSDGYIKVSLLNGDVSIDLLETRSYGSRPIVSSSGTLIYNSADVFGESITVRRMKPKNHIKSLKPVNVIMTGNFVGKFPDGYAVNKQFLSEEELALKLLSKDTDWDAAVIYSRQPFASEIALQGIFQPLDEQEYLESCRLHIRNACTTQDGKIWALPFEDNVNCIVYNKEKCNEYGIDFSKMTTYELLENSRQLCEDESMRGTWVNVSWQYLNETILNNCIYNFDADSGQFRSVMEALKQYANILYEKEYMQPNIEMTSEDGSIFLAQSNAFQGKTDEFLYETISSYTRAAYLLSKNPDLSVTKIPFEGTNTGYCKLLVVNPYAPNMEDTLELVSDFAQETSAEIQKYSEPKTEGMRQLDEVYDDSMIIMGIPDEIYRTDFWSYLGDEITLDEFASRVKDKMDMYLNE